MTRPGGLVAATVWDYGAGMEMLRTFWDEVVALDAGLAGRDAANMPLCREGELAALLKAEGLRDVSQSSIVIDLPFASFDDYWQPFLLGQGSAGAFVAGLAPERRLALASRLRQRLIGDGEDGPIAMKARAWVTRGTVTTG